MSQQGTKDEIYAFSKISGRWYRVDEWERLDDERIIAESETEVSVEEVPQKRIDSVADKIEEWDL